MISILSKILGGKKNETSKEGADDLDLYLIHCENQFFESSSVHSLKPEHRKTLLIALRLFYPRKDFNPKTKRHKVWTFFLEMYPFTDKEMQAYCDITPMETLFDCLADLPLKSRIAIVLIINCILNIDKNATEKQKELAKALYAIIDISPEYSKLIINDLKQANNHKDINYIYELA